MKKPSLLTLVAFLSALGLAATSAQAAKEQTPEDKLKSLDGKVQSLKSKAVELGKDITMLEEELLFPPSTQFVVFLSAHAGTDFKLVSAQLRANGQQIVNHLYSNSEQEALVNGGVQQLHIGNLKSGKHTLNVTYMGKIGKEMLRGSADFEFEKGKDPVYLEIDVKGEKPQPNEKPKAPTLTIKQWN